MGYYRALVPISSASADCGRCVCEGFSEKNSAKLLISAQNLSLRAKYKLYAAKIGHEGDASAVFAGTFYSDGKGRAEAKFSLPFSMEHFNVFIVSTGDAHNSEIYGAKGVIPRDWRQILLSSAKNEVTAAEALPKEVIAETPKTEKPQTDNFAAILDKAGKVVAQIEREFFPEEAKVEASSLMKEMPRLQFIQMDAPKPRAVQPNHRGKLLVDAEEADNFPSAKYREDETTDKTPARGNLAAIFTQNAEMSPFSTERPDITWVRASLTDIAALPLDYKKLADNPFLTDAFCEFKHLILGRKQGSGGAQTTYILGIPGVFSEEREAVAGELGFTRFKSRSGICEPGDHGYWLRILT
ncbi:hypothetical protein FACS189490_05040 [Clostridia bacterium]|nr:hypothetical protein FACS189490_05040 [Clostridia bacterium]